MIHTAESLQKWIPYLFVEEMEELKRLANLLPDNPVVVNFGAGNGTSAMCFMEARNDLNLVTIDIQRKMSPKGSLVAEREHLRKAGYWHTRNIEHFCMDSATVGGMWLHSFKREKVDLVFVDGGHWGEQPTKDILSWLPNIKKGGFMAVHDYNKKEVYETQNIPDNAPHPEYYEDVDRPVNEILVPNYEHISTVRTMITFRIKSNE